MPEHVSINILSECKSADHRHVNIMLEHVEEDGTVLMCRQERRQRNERESVLSHSELKWQ